MGMGMLCFHNYFIISLKPPHEVYFSAGRDHSYMPHHCVPGPRTVLAHNRHLESVYE